MDSKILESFPKTIFIIIIIIIIILILIIIIIIIFFLGGGGFPLVTRSNDLSIASRRRSIILNRGRGCTFPTVSATS